MYNVCTGTYILHMNIYIVTCIGILYIHNIMYVKYIHLHVHIHTHCVKSTYVFSIIHVLSRGPFETNIYSTLTSDFAIQTLWVYMYIIVVIPL